MPGRDQTGPMGAGSFTGRGMGVCVGVEESGETVVAPGRGRRANLRQGRGQGCGKGRGGFGRGFGRGCRGINNIKKTEDV